MVEIKKFNTELSKRISKNPVVAFIAGQTAPKGKRMGHAGAIISVVVEQLLKKWKL